MRLLNLSAERIIIHQIFRRDKDGKKVKPVRSHEYTNFDSTAMEAFKSRVVDALGEGSTAVQMEIVKQDKNDLPKLIDEIVSQNDDDFAVSSYDLADRLADVQQRRSIPGGIVVVFFGTQGANKNRYVGLIKAEVHSGYEKLINKKTNEISLKFVEELLLTPGTKLYKTAGFFETSKKNKNAGEKESELDLNEKWIVMVSDYQISRADGKAAARYFYYDFLGCDYPETSARTTKAFYDAACAFIDDMDETPEQKSELYNALVTYLKVENNSTVGASEFAEKYFDTDTQDIFTDYITEAGLPTTSFTKDTSHIDSKLKTRKLSFKSNIRLTAPSDVFESLVEIKTIDGESDESGNPTEWTKIIVKDRIVGQQ